jgi:O-antigen/teichoic acid export membrane protein
MLQHDKHKETIRQTGIYTFSVLITQGVNVIGGILMRHFLGPVQTGAWALIQVVLNYVDYATLGVTYAIPIELPYRRGKGEEAAADRLKDVILSFTLVSALIVSAGILGYAFWNRRTLSTELFWGLILASGLAILQEINNVLISLLRAYRYFELAGKQMIVSAVVNLLLVASLSAAFHIYGFLWAMMLSFVFNIVFISAHHPLAVRFRIDRADLAGLIRFGFPLMLLSMAGTLFLTLDRILISHYLGLESLGMYSIATMVVGFVFTIPNAVGVVMIPAVSERYGETGNVRDLRGYLLKSNTFFSDFMPFMLAAAWFAASLLVRLLLSKFAPGIDAMRYLVLGTFFMALAQPYGNFIIVTKQQRWMIPITGASLAVACVLNLAAIRAGYGIEGVAMATAVGAAFNFTASYVIAARQVFGLREAVMEYAFVWMKFAWTAAMLFGIEALVKGISNAFLSAGTALVLAGLFYGGFLWDAEKKLGLVTVLLRKYGLGRFVGPANDRA